MATLPANVKIKIVNGYNPSSIGLQEESKNYANPSVDKTVKSIILSNKEQVNIEITKGKMPLIGCGGLKTESDLNKAVDTGFSEFIGIGLASMMNRDFGILLKENKGDKLEVELDPEHPEKYSFPKNLWNMCLQGIDWLPHMKKK